MANKGMLTGEQATTKYSDGIECRSTIDGKTECKFPGSPDWVAMSIDKDLPPLELGAINF